MSETWPQGRGERYEGGDDVDYWHKAWTCPFFKWDDKKCVGCEGGKLLFADKESAVEYMDTYCASQEHGWKSCSVAASLLKYYDRKEENDHEES